MSTWHTHVHLPFLYTLMSTWPAHVHLPCFYTLMSREHLAHACAFAFSLYAQVYNAIAETIEISSVLIY